MSDLTPSIVSVLDELNESYQKTQASGGGYEQVGWPPANREYAALVKNITMINETKVFAGRDRDKIKCPAIKFSYETLPDLSDPSVNPDEAETYSFDGEMIPLIPPSELTGNLADTSGGIGWVFGNQRARLKGILSAITHDEKMPLGQSIALAMEKVNDGNEAVGVKLFVDEYIRKDKNTDQIMSVTYTDYARGPLDVSDATAG